MTQEALPNFWRKLSNTYPWWVQSSNSSELQLRQPHKLPHRGLLSRQPDHTYQVQLAPFHQEYDHFFWRNPRYCVNELAALEAALAENVVLATANIRSST